MSALEDQREIQKTAARAIWKRRKEPTPSGEHTWESWFAERFKRSLDEAVAEYRRERE